MSYMSDGFFLKKTYSGCFNSFQALAPLTGPEKWGPFLRGHISLKMGPFTPFLATIQALSSARAFLSGKNERELLCMGRTFTANKPLPLNNRPKQLSVSWESNPALVKASRKKYLV
jgi:hypothetical protein